MTTGRPFDDIRALTEGMPLADEKAGNDVDAIVANFDSRLNPLGQNQAYAKWLAGWQGRRCNTPGSMPWANSPIKASPLNLSSIRR